MKLEETNSNPIVGSTLTSNGVSKSSSYKQEQIISSASSKSTTVMKNISHQEQTHSTGTFHQNGNGSITNGNVLKVHHATMESVGHEFHQASSMQVQQTGYDGVSLFGVSRKAISNGQTNTVSNGQQHSDSKEKIVSCPMELPEVKPLSLTHNGLQNGNSAAPSERKEENNIASEYFQTKFGSENADSSAKKKAPVVSKQALVNEINSSIALKKSTRDYSAGVPQENQGGMRSRSKTTTPERGSRASSVSKQNGGDFSYLSLLPDDGTFPHRTHPIGNPQTSRRNSIQKGGTGHMSRAESTEYLNQTQKKNFMVRSNPIGLAEPSVKRDGYAVGKDGSFYRSSEHLFENKVSQSTSRASSETPEGNWRDRRRSSTSSGTGIRVGGGLVEPKAPAHGNSFMMPFGTTAVKPSNLVNLLKNPRSRSKSQQRSSSKDTKSSKVETKQKKFDIKTGTQEIQSLTSALNKKASTTTSTETTTMMFKEVDVRQQKKEEHNLSFTVNKPIQRRARHASLSKKQSTLPDQSVTISLPGSRRVSRTASVDRIDAIPENGLKKSNRSSSQEIFTGEYKMKIPSAKPTLAKESSSKCKLKMTAKVEELSSDTVVMKSNCDELEEAHTEATIKVPKIPAPPPPPPPATKDAPELQLVQVTVTPQNRPNKSGFTICSKNQMIENHPLATNNQFSLASSTSSRSTQASSILSSSSVAASKSTKVESVSQQQIKTETVMTQKMEQSSCSTQSMTTSTNVSNNTHVEGQKFNIAKPLKRTSHHGSKENLSMVNNHRRSKHASGTNECSSKRIQTKTTVTKESESKIGGHLKGLDVALEALAKQQKEQELKELKLTQNTQKSMLITQQHTTKDGTTSVTVSLPPSRRGSRRGSISEGGGQIRSRKDSMDLYSANYNVRLSRQGSPTRIQQKSACHIRVDDKNSSKIKLCPRCHAPDHDVQSCIEFGGLMCPRCMEWDHWEDTCWTNLTSDDRLQCLSCPELGHSSSVHDATDYKQRRSIVDTLGWENFKEWFYDSDFRSWWQLNGCVGVPLYKLYKRNNEWKNTPVKPEIDTNSSHENSDPSNMSIEERASLLAAKYSSKYDRSKLTGGDGGSKLKREDSTDDLMKSIALSNSRRAKRIEDMMKNEDNDDVVNGNANNAGTKDDLKKYTSISNNADDGNNKDVNSNCSGDTTSKKLRTFSETLKMLDDDIVADLNVK